MEVVFSIDLHGLRSVMTTDFSYFFLPPSDKKLGTGK